jgi:hypothetical protein
MCDYIVYSGRLDLEEKDLPPSGWEDCLCRQRDHTRRGRTAESEPIGQRARGRSSVKSGYWKVFGLRNSVRDERPTDIRTHLPYLVRTLCVFRCTSLSSDYGQDFLLSSFGRSKLCSLMPLSCPSRTMRFASLSAGGVGLVAFMGGVLSRECC